MNTEAVNSSATTCCPKFDPALWDEKTHHWKEKLFIKDVIPQIFHIPLPSTMNRTIGRMWEQAQQAKAAPDLKDFLMLSYDPSPWKSQFYLAVTKEVPGTENVKLSGTFISKVFDGPYNQAPKWIKEMEQYVAAKGQTVKKHYFYYTTCPKCAKIYGHNYVVSFAEV
ncbi:MAG: hydrolase [Bacillota bacterium]